MSNQKQLNPFEIKAEIIKLISEFKNVNDFEKYVNVINLLDIQNDRKTICKILFKEFYNVTEENSTVLCFLLERYFDRDELTKKLCDILKNNIIPNSVKIVAINFLRGLDNDWELDCGDEVLQSEFIDVETKKLLHNAIIDPEVQIDFLDFLASLSTNDKILLINSLSDDYEKDELANILIPVFLSQSNNEVGLEALKILGNSKSQLAFHALNLALDTVDSNVIPFIKKSLSTLKIAGTREDNTKEFYKNVLSDSKPDKCLATFPDGHGNQALIFTRKTNDNRIRFIAIVVDDYFGIKDCFGFFNISEFESNAIIEKFYKNDKIAEITPKQLKSILKFAENTNKNNNSNRPIPYEYLCWKNLLNDIESEDIIEFLDNNIEKHEIDKDDLETICLSDETEKWFLDENYSDEFEELISEKIIDVDKAVNENVDKVFYEEEKLIWAQRLLLTAYISDKSDIFYNLYYNQNLLDELFKNILRKSLYEYYINLKHKKIINENYSQDEIDKIISNIEELWVCTK